MSSAEIRVYATWDEEAQVWWARSDDIAGLATEAATMEDLHRKLSIIIPELVELNGWAGDHEEGASLPVCVTSETLFTVDMRKSA